MYTCIRWFLKKLRTKNDAVYISLHLFEVLISEEYTYVLQDNHKQRDGFNTHNQFGGSIAIPIWPTMQGPDGRQLMPLGEMWVEEGSEHTATHRQMGIWHDLTM